MNEQKSGFAKPKDLLPEYIKMYEVSGQDLITRHSLNRYIKNTEQDFLIKEQVDNSSDNFEKKIKEAITDEEKISLIKEGLKSSNIEMQKASVISISFLTSKEKISSLVKLCLKSDDLDIEAQKEAIGMIDSIPEKERSFFIKQCSENPNIEIQKISIEQIGRAPIEDRVSLIRLFLGNPKVIPEVQAVSAKAIMYLPVEERASLINLGLKSIHPEVRESVAGEVSLVRPEKEKISLIKSCLENPNVGVQNSSAAAIGLLPSSDERSSLVDLVSEKIKEGLENPNMEIQKKVIEMIAYASQDKRHLLIRKGLESPYIQVQTKAASMLLWARDENLRELEKILSEKVRQGLKNPDIEVQKDAVYMIWFVPERDKFSLVKLCLENPSIEVQKRAVKLIVYVEIPEEKKKLFDLMLEKDLGEELIKHSLYRNNNIDNKSFSRQEFAKTGSQTTLIGGELKDKTILRHIKPEAFLTWQKIYEDYASWKEFGFDYVPIEPIVSYSLNLKKEQVDVFSVVLDLNFDDWMYKTEMFYEELRKQRDRIKEVLYKLKVNHRHIDGNFCLRFFRNEDSSIDFKKTPRLYLIDFDAAVFEEK